MNTVYLDTNIFIYSSQAASPFFSDCNSFIKYSLNNHIDLATSTESIQEIVHLAKKTKKISTALKTAKILLNLTQLLLPLDKETIVMFLDLIRKNSRLGKLESRDFIHLASCLRYNINLLITYDNEFKKFKEIQTLTPEEFLKKFKN